MTSPGKRQSPWFRRLRSKFLAAIVPTLLIAFIGVVMLFEMRTRALEQDRLAAKLDTFLANEAAILENAIWNLDYERITLVLKAAIADPEVAHIAVSDQDGMLLFEANGKHAAHPGLQSEQSVYFGRAGGSELIGVISASLSTMPTDMERSQRLAVLGALALLLIFAALASTLIANRWIVEAPVRRLLDAIQSDAPGVADMLEKEATRDELGDVMRSFAELKRRQARYEQRLKASRNQLEERVRERTSELVRMRDEARAADRAKSQFLANMSHELRTPLNAIIGFSTILEGEVFGPLGAPKYSEYARDIHSSGLYLLDLIDDLIDLSRIEIGALDLKDEDIDLGALTADTMRVVRGWTTSQALRISTETTDQPCTVRADSRALKQILLNILSNAVKFTPVGGRITLRTEINEAGEAVITVSDTGPGIKPEDLERLFEPFSRGREAYVREHEGSGLGLALVKSLIEAHDGVLDIQSRSGEGVTARMTLPSERVTCQSKAA